ncbi:MAG: lysophospholipid acyltransferase family protein [Bacteroidetes bacterium]|nr:lysophospholipid acyltransferase family protein [Bacteroidota bacterium]
MYYIVYPLLYLFSLLPFFILYAISDAIAFLLYHIVRYRRDVVSSNLAIAFPQKSAAERNKIAKQFYQYFTDSFIENIKFLSISKKQMQRRTTGTFDIINTLLAEGKSINLLCGHQFNWEYANLLYSATLKIPFVTVYLPVKNKVFNRIMYKIRTRFNAILVSPAEFGTRMHHVFNAQHALVLAADQSPATPKSGYWINFFNRPTLFLIGPEKSAIRKKAAVVYVGFKRVKRGYYHFESVLLTKDASQTDKRAQLTCLYRDALENAINNDPANYLWSHRRFKFEWQPEFGAVLG